MLGKMRSRTTVDATGPEHGGHPEVVDDINLLAELGYKQELRRQYSTLEIFAVAFSIMGLIPSIASTIAFSLPAGPVGMVWGWFTASILIFFVGLAMADMASAMPTAGGLYWWTHYFAGDKFKNPLSFLVGYSNTLGLVGGMCSVDYTLSLLLLGCISIARDGEWSASQGTIYGVYAGMILVHALCAVFAGPIMNKIQTFSIFVNVGMIIATVVALPVGKISRGESLNSAKFVFGDVENLTTWPTGWTFILAFLAPIWSIGFFDSCVHMSEEALHAAKAVPLGIIWSSGCATFLGFLVLSVIAASMNPDVSATMSSKFGQPMVQIYFDALGKKGALGFTGVLIVIQFLVGLSLVSPATLLAKVPRQAGVLIERDCRCIPPSMGVLPRWRPPLLQLLPPCQQTHPLPAGAGDHRICGRVHCCRAAVSDQLDRSQRVVLPVRGEQLCRLGNPDSVPGDLEQDALQTGRVLHGETEPADCHCGGPVVGVWTGAVYVPERRTESNSDDDELHNRDQWVCVDCVHDVLCPVCAQVVHGPQDDNRSIGGYIRTARKAGCKLMMGCI